MLAAMVRKMGRNPSTAEKVDIAQRRERLQARIDTYDQQAAEFWAPEDVDIPLDGSNNHEPEGLPSDSEDEEQAFVFLSSPLNDSHFPETAALLLPSTIGLQACQEAGYSAFVKQERTLRVGQANDALQGLRLALSRKAVIFREGVRTAKSKTRKLRSWDQILMVDVNVRHHARIYIRARSAMIRLGAALEDLERYQPLKKEHLSVTTARIDPSLRGQRNTSLAWFWTMDIQGDTDSTQGMAECEY
jgi:hypothetical protein